MDRCHNSIQLGKSLGSSSATQPSDDGMMSSELYLAVVEGRRNEVMALLPHSGAVSSAHQVVSNGIHDEVGDNVLHLAAEQGHHELIQDLYASFGDKSLLSSQNSYLDTPLHCAARAGHERAVSLLVKFARGCGDEGILRCKNQAGDTALLLAAEYGHGAVVEVIVSAAPELASEFNGAGVSPLYLAVMSRSVLAVRAITSRCSDASAAGPSSLNALHAAAFKSSAEMVGLLLDWKPSLASEADDSGSTPLHCASSYGDHSIVDSIMRAVPPCVVRMQDSDGLSSLHVAAGMGYSRVAEALMDACPHAASLRDNSGGTFVHAAARGGYSKVVSLAIKKPMLYRLRDMQDGDGNTPLHLAVAADMPLVALVLLRNGKVPANLMNNDGDTPWDLAAISNSLFSMLTLAAFGAHSSPRTPKWSGRDIIAKGIEKTSDGLAMVTVLIAAAALLWLCRSALHMSSLVSMFLAFYAALSAVTRIGPVHDIIYYGIYVALFGLFISVTNLISAGVSI